MTKIKIIRYKDRTLSINSSDIIDLDQLIKDCNYDKSTMAVELLAKYFKKHQFFYCKGRVYELFRTDKET